MLSGLKGGFLPPPDRLIPYDRVSRFLRFCARYVRFANFCFQQKKSNIFQKQFHRWLFDPFHTPLLAQEAQQVWAVPGWRSVTLGPGRVRVCLARGWRRGRPMGPFQRSGSLRGVAPGEVRRGDTLLQGICRRGVRRRVPLEKASIRTPFGFHSGPLDQKHWISFL